MILSYFLFFIGLQHYYAQTSPTFIEIKGKIIDEDSKDALIFADIIILDSNMSTITNSDGEFVLKVPDSLTSKAVIFSHLGYQKKELKISELISNSKITLTPSATELSAIEIKTFKNAETLLRETLKNRHVYNSDNALMTGFYRETIKKRRKNASLSEAVVQIHKQPYSNFKNDAIELIKSRKSTDYTRLDTLAVKLQGGPFCNLYTDIIKYPEYIFTNDNIPLYDFSFGESTQVNNNPVYVINFKQKPSIIEPLYYGKLYIDSKTLALTNAVFSLNVENRKLASEMYIRKKPRKVDVYPTEATYRVNYRTQNGKWQYAYSNILLTFKVNWKGKLFNSIYTLNSEMAITDWRVNNTNIAKSRENMLKPTTILADETSGFKDPAFWGEYNIIEPEKSIESAIEKIKKQLKRT
ncbi:carboxypeptidase-like regulatory domain-containing protein [Mariniflexile fucanivorans]|uniref:carboxypeptidase-like regulatory domain-containing protein n=1 Tax=Mariniflexile fucanivorans TaxID=264023 RepID=UPI001FB3872C|nr:carboxypeptidase-like regulatory domain-containing protein [Mariniflexile fucanivorans]